MCPSLSLESAVATFLPSSTAIEVRKVLSLWSPVFGFMFFMPPWLWLRASFLSYLIDDGTILFYNCGGWVNGFAVMCALWCLNGAWPLSKAGVKSTSLGIIPLLRRLSMPSLISFSVIGGGSANGSSRKFLGRILLAKNTLFGLLVPMPSFSSSMLLIPPWLLPYLKRLGYGSIYFSLKIVCPLKFSGSRVK